MKKVMFIMLIIVLGGSLWARDFSVSAGTGGFVGGLFTRYDLEANGSSLKINAGQNQNQFNYGALLFVDATYGELGVFIQNGISRWKQILDISGSSDPDKGDGWETMLSFSLLGKYPFHFGSRFSVFPLLGMEFQISLIQKRTVSDGDVYERDDGLRERDKDGNAYKLSDWNSFFVEVGFGADFAIMKRIYLRGELLYAFRLMTSYEKKNLDLIKTMTGDNDPSMGGLTSGPIFRLAVGYRFFSI